VRVRRRNELLRYASLPLVPRLSASSTIARRTAVTLIGSYVAFNTNTGSASANRAGTQMNCGVYYQRELRWKAQRVSAAMEGLCPRGLGVSCRIALMALPLANSQQQPEADRAPLGLP